MKNKPDLAQEQEHLVADILQKCLDADTVALHVYREFASLPLTDDIINFFKQMQLEESRHVAFWRGLQKISQDGFVLQLFEDPGKTAAEISVMYKGAEQLYQEVKRHRYRTIPELFYATLRIEFAFLHPPFLELFRFAEFVPGHQTMEQEYSDHISHITNMLRIHSFQEPLLKLSADYITRLWETSRDFYKQGILDAASGVLTRQGFYQQLRPLAYLAMRREFFVGLMILDIDDFKKVNDTHGHHAGDAVLAMVSDFIVKNVRKSDIVGRFGGDEFTVFFSDVTEEVLVPMAEKIAGGISGRKSGNTSVTVSIGISMDRIVDQPDLVVERLLGEADKALYEAKHGGKNCFRIFGKTGKTSKTKTTAEKPAKKGKK